MSLIGSRQVNIPAASVPPIEYIDNPYEGGNK